MCGGSTPSIPTPKPIPAPRPQTAPQQIMQEAPRPAPAPPDAVVAPPPAPPIEMDTPTPPPQAVATDNTDVPKVKKQKSKRATQQQAAGGTEALRIPLNTGETGKKSSKTAGLNI